jgi:ribonuclease J
VTPAEIEITALGGLGEFGKNCLVVRAGPDAIVVDAGISFPDESLPGVDRLAPDFSPLSADRVAGVFLTHGHEDHIGALSLLCDISDAPIFATEFTRSLARRRLLEAGLDSRGRAKVGAASFGAPIAAGPFSVTFLPVSHSVPQSAALLIEVLGRRILHTGDFKLDGDVPAGERTDLADLSRRAAGCDLLILDSTNAERSGSCPSERVAREGLLAAVSGVSGRILVTTFSSHVARMQSAVEAARAEGREIAILGRSMREIAEIGEQSGYLSIPASLRADPEGFDRLRPGRLLVLCAGSQGELHSALSRLSAGRHDLLRLGPGDLAIFSARTIPGRERAVSRMVDGLLRRGARVLPGAPESPVVHVSGHAYRDDLKRLVEAVHPRAVLPAHGERQALLACAAIAHEAGVPRGEIFVCDNGDSVFLGNERRLVAGARPARAIFLDSAGGLEISDEKIRQRKTLGSQGAVVVAVFLRAKAVEIDVASRGVAAPAFDVSTEVAKEVRSALAGGLSGDREDPRWIESEAELAAKRACRRAFGIRPLIVVTVSV